MSTLNLGPTPTTSPTQAEPYVTITVSEYEALKNGSTSKPSAFMTAVFTHWKSTAKGLLVFASATGLALQKLDPSLLGPKVTAGVSLGLGLCYAWLGMISKDASALTSSDISKQTAVATAKQA